MATPPLTSGLEVAFELADFGARIVAERHRRLFPNASEADVAAVVDAWWADRRCAPDGDAVGRVRRLDP